MKKSGGFTRLEDCSVTKSANSDEMWEVELKERRLSLCERIEGLEAGLSGEEVGRSITLAKSGGCHGNGG